MKIIVLSLFLCCPAIGHAEMLNNCRNLEAQVEWQAAYNRNSHYEEWQQLHQLRRHLCNRIDRGRISVEEAHDKFEQQRQKAIERLSRKARVTV